MSDSTTVAWMAKAIGEATRAAKFVVAGGLPGVDPGLEVDGLGAVKLPLKPKAAKALVAACQIAPFGKGTQTLVDTKVRKTYELDPQKFRLGEAWNAAIDGVIGALPERLGLPAGQLEARLYKLLAYEKGGFFRPHRDSEKNDRMVASLIVVLPNPFEGGSLTVRHDGERQTFAFAEAARGQAAEYAAFYADCEHEVERVTRGVRLALAYNLVLKPKRGKPAAAAPAAPADVLAESMRAWFARQPAEPLVFALEHHYTQRGLALDLLKGADREIAGLVVAAAAKTDSLVHLAQVTRHLTESAYDGSYGYEGSRHYRPPRDEIEVGEVIEDELSGSDWTDVKGKKQAWNEIAFDPAAIVSSTPLDDWKPTTEEYEGYTGNAGNTLDRWYHRSALVVWPREHHFDVVASAGASGCIPSFGAMTAKLAKTPKKRLEAARLDCLRFARAIIERWLRRSVDYWSPHKHEKSVYDEFPEQLLALHDRDTIARFLRKLAEVDSSLRLSAFVVAACREFGWPAFASELENIFAPRPEAHRREEIPYRDLEWLAALCCDKATDPEKLTLARGLCARAVERFCEPEPSRSSYHSPEASISERSLPLLLKALVASGCENELARVLQFVQDLPSKFRLDECLAPSLNAVIPWARQRLGALPAPLAAWLASVRQRLEAATAKRPPPPANAARPADAACPCAFCAQLNAFLADPVNLSHRIPAAEDKRRHLINIIDRHQLDVTHVLQRTGSPYSLVLTKTTGSYKRAVKRFETDLRLLSELPPE